MARTPRKLAGIGASDLPDAAAFDAYIGPAREVTVDPARGIVALHDGLTAGGKRFASSTALQPGDIGVTVQGKLSGTLGQVVGFNAQGNAVATNLPNTGDMLKSEYDPIINDLSARSPATVANTMLVDSSTGVRQTRTFAQVKTLLGIGANVPVPAGADAGKALIAQANGSYQLEEIITKIEPVGRYQVAANRTIIAPDGSRFIVKGVQMFDYLFCGFEARTDQRYREAFVIAGRGAGSGVSNPTGYAKVSYKNEAYVESQIGLAQRMGANLIRVGVEPAVQFASEPYVDPGDSQTYPSDIVMLDTIIDVAERHGMVVQLQQSNDDVSNTHNITFLKWLAGKYFKRPHVWINPMNEPLGYTSGGANVNNATMWNNKVGPLVTALRADIAGQPAGTKFLNPVCVDPPGWAERIDLVTSQLAAAPYSTDPNLIINVHIYGRSGDYDFRNARLPEIRTRWANYLQNFCIVVGEMGIDNLAGRLDPNIDPAIPSVSPTDWTQQQSFTQDFLRWVTVQLPYSPLSGIIGHMWFAYIPGMSQHDDNTMFRQDGSLTTWGQIYRSYYLTPTMNDLSFYQQLTGLDLTKVGSASIGTPVFQAEGKTGARAAGVFIAQGAQDTYIGFHNRTTNLTVGTIRGTSGGGTVYNTTSDERLKGGIRDPDAEEVIATFEAMRPRKGHYLADPDTDMFMFVAHELQEALPVAVTGERGAEKDGQPLYQMVDYSVPMPLVVAMMKIMWDKIKTLENK